MVEHALLDYPIRLEEQQRRDREAECLGHMAASSVIDLKDYLYVYGDSPGELAHTDDRAGMTTIVSEDFHHEIREAVHHIGLSVESWGAVDHAENLDDLADVVEAPKGGADSR